MAEKEHVATIGDISLGDMSFGYSPIFNPRAKAIFGSDIYSLDSSVAHELGLHVSGTDEFYSKDTTIGFEQGLSSTRSVTMNSTETEIESIIRDGLISHWEFNEGSGSTAIDSHGSNDGNIIGATYSTDSVVNDYSLKFGGDNSGDYVDTGNDWFVTGSGSRTVVCWYKLDTSTADTSRSSLFNFGNDGGSSERDFCARLNDEEDEWRAQFWSSDRDYTATNSYDGNWHHKAYSYDGSTVRIYHDGNEVSTLDVTLDTGDSVGYIGQWRGDSDEYWGGNIDDVRYYNRELSASEISDIYNLNG